MLPRPGGAFPVGPNALPLLVAGRGTGHNGAPSPPATAVPPSLRRLLPPALVVSLLGPLLVAGPGEVVLAQWRRPAPPAVVAPPEGGPTIRVLLAQASTWTLPEQAGALRLLDGRGRLLRLLAPGEQLRVRRSGTAVALEVLPSEGESLSLAPQVAGIWLEPLAEPPQWPAFAFAKERYRGRLQILPAGAAQLQAINHLPLETYLASVVGSEMPASWPQAALRAQAVAARTYALSHRRPASPFDVKATVASQVYRGLAAETDSTRAAVAATRGQVLKQQGRLIQAVFHSSSGGSTEDSGQVWSRQLPYLVSVPDFDHESPVSRWTLRLEPEQLRQLFRETDGVRRIDVLASSSSGRIRRARVIGPAGAVELSGGELRQRLGLRSTLVTFQFQPVPPAANAGVIGRAVGQALPGLRGSPAPAWAGQAGDGAGGAWLPEGADGDGDASADGGPPPLSDPQRGLPAPRPAPEPFSFALVVEGRGFGHGVGMSQWGAHAMARRGLGHEQILMHYYRGVELVTDASP